MCGIAGMVRWDGPADRFVSDLQKMSDNISHRGPDDDGFMVAGPNMTEAAETMLNSVVASQYCADAHVGLAHRRLSVIDLTRGGHQPQQRKKEGAWVLYNGETYNFRELRRELETQGVAFSTQSDTEVVLAAYEFWGEGFITRCNGMFALAIVDPVKNQLLLYRDRVGIKPLFIHQSDSGLSFASEMKAVLAVSGVNRVADKDAIYAYLDKQIVQHRPETFVRGIRELQPGHFMRVDLNTRQTDTVRYYDLGERVIERRDQLPTKEADQTDYVRDLFQNTVRSHLISDVHVGSCLSGGVDSSSIVCVLNNLLSNSTSETGSLGEKITTFSSCHTDQRYDEQTYIDIVNEHCATEPVKIFPSPDDLVERLDQLIWYQDEPFTSPSIFAQFQLMEAARTRDVTVLLDGQGGDEIFAGYRKFFYFHVRELLAKGKMGAAANELCGGLTKGDGDLFNLRAMRRYMPKNLQQNITTIGSFIHGSKEADLAGFGVSGSMSDRQILDIERFSVPALLRYEDRNSMAFGVEARVPFLDHSMIETGIALPAHAKIKGGVAKNIMREAMRGIVPDEILDRRTKMGFATPEIAWMRTTLRPLMEELFTKPQPLTSDLVDVKAVERHYKEFIKTGKGPLSAREFFRLLCLDRWASIFNVASA